LVDFLSIIEQEEKFLHLYISTPLNNVISVRSLSRSEKDLLLHVNYLKNLINKIIPDKGVGALNEDAILTSAGALEKIPVCRVNSLMKAVDELHMNGIKVFASEMTAAKNVYDCDFREPAAIVMGSEEKGIYPALLKICDEKIKIPMKGDFESLNVSVATGMILYEVMKQRGV
jgi:tRNA G18 (ribose-2'-O)-methylase SpoU